MFKWVSEGKPHLLKMISSQTHKIMFPKLFLFFLCLVCAVRASEHTHLPKPEDIIKTIMTHDGDIFDCVDIHKQPAFSHPLLKDHKLQMRPTSYPEGLPIEDFSENTFPSVTIEGEGCPDGSVPILRLSSNISKAFMGHEGKLVPDHNNPIVSRGSFALTKTKGGSWYGGTAAMNVYGVPNVGRDQLSATYIFAQDPNIGAGVLAGWTAYPEILGDGKTRSFVAYMNDGMKLCYNVLCPGFVLVHSKFMLGAPLQPLSTYGGQQYGLRMYLIVDSGTNNWWVAVGALRNTIGYWPSELFQKFYHANTMYFGGSTSCYPGEMCPPMGNGHFPSEDSPTKFNACFFEDVQFYVKEDNVFYNFTSQQITTVVTSPNCYNVGDFKKNVNGFSFGGPGCHM